MQSGVLASWQLWALLSAMFASLTAIFAKVGVEQVSPDVATFIRTAVILVALTLLVAAGFVLDGGLAMAGWVTADNEAQQSARAGAQALNLTVYRETGQAALDPTAAAQAARAFLAPTGDTGTVTVTGETVTVTVTHTGRTGLLSLIGITSFTEHATATSTAEQTG